MKKSTVDNDKRKFLKICGLSLGVAFLSPVLKGCKKKKDKLETKKEEKSKGGKKMIADNKQKIQKDKGDKKMKTENKQEFKKWIGKIDRKAINWGPTVNEKKCIGCGMCMNCGRKVYVFETDKAKVKYYDKCVPGCNTCANLCPPQAISFPDIKPMVKILHKEGVYDNMKKWLKAKGVITS